MKSLKISAEISEESTNVLLCTKLHWRFRYQQNDNLVDLFQMEKSFVKWAPGLPFSFDDAVCDVYGYSKMMPMIIKKH